MAPPYKKQQNSDAIDDGWTIEDGDGEVIAHLDTETLTDHTLAALLGDAIVVENYPIGVTLGEAPRFA